MRQEAFPPSRHALSRADGQRCQGRPPAAKKVTEKLDLKAAVHVGHSAATAFRPRPVLEIWRRCLELDWLTRRRDTRAVWVTSAGRTGLFEAFGLDLNQLEAIRPSRVHSRTTFHERKRVLMASTAVGCRRRLASSVSTLSITREPNNLCTAVDVPSEIGGTISRRWTKRRAYHEPAPQGCDG